MQCFKVGLQLKSYLIIKYTSMTVWRVYECGAIKDLHFSIGVSRYGATTPATR